MYEHHRVSVLFTQFKRERRTFLHLFIYFFFQNVLFLSGSVHFASYSCMEIDCHPFYLVICFYKCRHIHIGGSQKWLSW